MKENSRIRFNPVTKEIEIEGSEEFVKTYFDKIQSMLSVAPKVIADEPKVEEVRSEKKPQQKKTTKKEPAEKKVTNMDTVIGLIQGSAEGISTAELKEKTGLVERQIWSIVDRAAKLGKIRKMKRGLYRAG